MKFIKPTDHLETLIGSISKMFFIAKTKAIVRNKELYLINLIARILNTQELTNDEQKKLASLYYGLLNKYSFLCRAELTRNYFFEQKKVNETYIATKCAVQPKQEKIFFWQEEEISTTFANVKAKVDDEGFFADKDFFSFDEFEAGKEIEYENIGRICFSVTEVDDTNFIIKDIYNNDVTDAFDVELMPSIGSLLFVSKNFFSYGNINFKIIKT